MTAEIILFKRAAAAPNDEEAAAKTRAVSDAAKIEARRIVANHIDSGGLVDKPWSLVDAIAGAIRRAAIGAHP